MYCLSWLVNVQLYICLPYLESYYKRNVVFSLKHPFKHNIFKASLMSVLKLIEKGNTFFCTVIYIDCNTYFLFLSKNISYGINLLPIDSLGQLMFLTVHLCAVG